MKHSVNAEINKEIPLSRITKGTPRNAMIAPLKPCLLYTSDWSTNPANFQPVGTGPFKFVSYEKSVAIRMERNEDYFKGAPYIDELIVSIIPDESTAFQAWQNGEVDDILGKAPSSEIAALKQDPNYNCLLYTSRCV